VAENPGDRHADAEFSIQLDISDDGFLSLMADDGETKDDVKVPDGEVGEKIERLFRTEEKDTSELYCSPCARAEVDRPRRYCSYLHGRRSCHRCQGSSALLNGMSNNLSCYLLDMMRGAVHAHLHHIWKLFWSLSVVTYMKCDGASGSISDAD